MAQALVIDDYYELLALHKGLMEARFSESPNNFYVAGSPLLADLHRKVIVAMTTMEAESGQDPHCWDQWLLMDDTRREWRLALNNANLDSSWSQLGSTEKEERARSYLAPFVVSDELLKHFLRLADLTG